VRFFGVRLTRLFLPPRRPSATAAGFFFFAIRSKYMHSAVKKQA
jgi:hypothetical protein